MSGAFAGFVFMLKRGRNIVTDSRVARRENTGRMHKHALPDGELPRQLSAMNLGQATKHVAEGRTSANVKDGVAVMMNLGT